MFVCNKCQAKVDTEGNIGTSNRNHCPCCGYSLHVDEKDGDRKSLCNGLMKPLALSYKSKGELSLVHQCLVCGKIHKNRIAADDSEKMLMDVFHESLKLGPIEGGVILKAEDEEDLKTQLFGKA